MSEIVDDKVNTIARHQNDPTLSLHQMEQLTRTMIHGYLEGRVVNDDETWMSICQLLQEIDDHYSNELAQERGDLLSLLGRWGRSYQYKPCPVNVKEVEGVVYNRIGGRWCSFIWPP